jgi:hypothetical protein
MGERIDSWFTILVITALAGGALTIAGALLMIARGEYFDGLLIAAAALLLLRWFWRATQRKRALMRRGYFVGSRVGAHWVYQELHESEVLSLELTLEYLGRGEYELHVPSEHDWLAGAPAWARGRRAEIIERLQSVFKRNQIRFDADSNPTPRADG